MSSISATSISGLRDAEEDTEITSGDEASTAAGTAVFVAREESNLCCVTPMSAVGMTGSGGELSGRGSRTLMVTLLGVPDTEGRTFSPVSQSCASMLGSGADETGRKPLRVGVLASSSADMLLYDRSPLSSLGRFLVREGSESSIELRRGGLSPAEFDRTGVEGAPNESTSMTLSTNLNTSSKG